MMEIVRKYVQYIEVFRGLKYPILENYLHVLFLFLFSFNLFFSARMNVPVQHILLLPNFMYAGVHHVGVYICACICMCMNTCLFVYTRGYVHLGQLAFIARISARILNSQCSKIGSLQVANTILDAIGQRLDGDKRNPSLHDFLKVKVVGISEQVPEGVDSSSPALRALRIGETSCPLSTCICL